VALFLHTSGTTSWPKGVPLTQRNLAASVQNIRAAYRFAETDAKVVTQQSRIEPLGYPEPCQKGAGRPLNLVF
jgi:acyl-CoA synthetase (AMP-forming)/AMP-acid ligase II